RAPSATQRELRAHTLGTTFRALANAGGGVLADRVAQFAIAAREAVASGVAVTSPGAVAAELRRAGDVLARSGSGDEEALAAELGSRAGSGGRPYPAIPRRSRARAGPGAARRGEAGDRRLTPRPRRRSLRPRCARPRAQSRFHWLLTALPPRGGRGSWGSGSRSGCWPGRCTASAPATWPQACGGRTAGSCW